MGTTDLGAVSSDAASGTLVSQPPASRGRRWPWPAGFIAAGLVLFAAYLLVARQVPVMSDGASNQLQAWDMLHGNVLLRGWTLSRVSFYTIELPEYMLLEAIHGLNAGSAHVASALNYTLVLIGAALLAKGRAGGREGVVRAVLAGGIMLAPTLGIGGTVTTLLANPDHVGTQIPLLAVWLILDRARPRWFVPVSVAALLAWAQVSDQLATFEGALPLVLVCAIRLYRRRDVLAWKPGDSWHEKLRESWYELSLAAASIVSVEVARMTVRLIRHAGGYTVWPNATVFTSVASVYSHVWVTVESVIGIFGADFSHQRLGAHVAINLVHLAGVALAGWAFARALRRFTSCELVVQVLAVTAVVLLLSYTLDGDYTVSQGSHEIVGLLPVGAALAGRLLAGRLISGRHLAALGVVLGCYLLALAHSVVQPPGNDQNSQLASWLEAHHLDYGLATYWNASVVTVDSGGRVQVIPVVRQPGTDRVAAIQWNSEPSWYNPRLHDARFLVVPGPRSGCTSGTPSQWRSAISATFGPPAASYQADGITVLVWDKNLLDHVFKPVGLC